MWEASFPTNASNSCFLRGQLTFVCRESDIRWGELSVRSFLSGSRVGLVVVAGLSVLSAGCVTTNQAKVSMLQAPEIEDATRFRAISVAPFSGQYGEAVSADIEAALVNARVQDKPVYRSVARAPAARSLGGDPRSLMAAAQAQGSDAIIVGEVVRADTQDQPRTTTEFVCDQTEKPNRLFSKCVSGRNVTVYCTDRIASMLVQVRLLDAKTGMAVYNEAITKTAKSEACGNDRPTDSREMLAVLKSQIVDDVKRKIVPHDRQMLVTLMDADSTIKSDAARSRFDGAAKFAREGRMDRACDMFRDIYDGEKNSIALNYNLGVCEEAAGAFWKASEYYRLADRMTNEPNKLIGEALERNERNIKKGGALSQNRTDLVGAGKLEAGAAPQTIASGSYKNTGGGASAAAPQPPANVTADTLLLEKRTALVIGNAKYRQGALLNPVNDARAVTAELRKANFRVISVEDAGATKMNAAIDDFGRAIKEGGVAMVFYAGHGMQVKGENYLIPVDADLKGEGDVPYKTVNLGYILSKLDDAKARVNIVVLDACRDNPFARSWRSTKGGLASIDAPSGTMIAYATAPGKTAADGSGANGLFTSHFIRQLRVPNLKLEDVLKNTRKAVAAESNNEQIPWDSSSLTGDFYFRVAKDAR